MNCPTCNIALLISERQGIEIDYCQKCRGVWLDRGELDKLIERAGSTGVRQQDSGHDDDDDDKKGYGQSSKPAGFGMGGMGKRRERENPIGELFDFF